MRSRSSIFSSDTLAASLWPTAAVVFALALCVLLRLLIGWVGPGYTGLFGYWLVDTDMGFSRLLMDREPVAGKPRCLVMGSSRIGLGIHAPTLADALGWQVIKTPVSVGTPWTFLYMFEAEPQLLDDVEFMIIDVEYFQFNDNSPVREGLRYDRLRGPESWEQRLWPIDRERRDLMEVVKGVSLDITGGGPYRPMHERWARYDRDRRQDPGMLPEAAAHRVMDDFAFSESMVETWRELAALCEARGMALFVIHPPVQAAFVDLLNSREDWVRHRERVDAAIAEIGSWPAVTVIFTEQVADADLHEPDDAMLMDYGHMTGAGARAYTAWLGTEIRQRLAAKPNPGGGASSAGS